MTAPLVGVTTYAPSADSRGDDRHTLPAAYSEAVRRAGGVPVLLPSGEPKVADLLDRLDGLVLAGGGDLDPAAWGGAADATNYGMDAGRDTLELELVRRVIDGDVPTLAICRGSQVVNVALGGTLHNHLPDVVGDHVAHRTDPPGPIPHRVRVDGDTLVARLMGATEVRPASWHHQAVDRLGDDLRATAWAPDGVIEATEHDGHRWLACVQWHPEITAHEDPTQQALFDGLVEELR
jgi:putative glutamine amidotransferase